MTIPHKLLDIMNRCCIQFCGAITAIFGLYLSEGIIVIAIPDWFAPTIIIIGLTTMFLPYISPLLKALGQRKTNKSLEDRIREVEDAD